MTDHRDEPEALSSEELIRRARAENQLPTPPAPSSVYTEETAPAAWPEIPGASDPTPPPPGAMAGIWTVARWIIGGVVILWFLGRFFGGGTSLDALEIGDCFDDPGEIAEVSTVDAVACSEPHDLELYSTVTMGSDDRIFPGVDQLFSELEEECVARFDGYVGADYWMSVYDIVLFTPLRDGWSEGDRTGMCALYEFDSTLQPIQTIGTARDSGR